MAKYKYYNKQADEEWREITGDHKYYNAELKDWILVPYENLEIWDQDEHFEVAGVFRLVAPEIPEGYHRVGMSVGVDDSGKPFLYQELVEIPQTIIQKAQFLTGLVHIGILNMDALVEAGHKNETLPLVMSAIKKSLTVAETIAIITKWNSGENNIMIDDVLVKAILDEYTYEERQKFFNEWFKI